MEPKNQEQSWGNWLLVARTRNISANWGNCTPGVVVHFLHVGSCFVIQHFRGPHTGSFHPFWRWAKERGPEYCRHLVRKRWKYLKLMSEKICIDKFQVRGIPALLIRAFHFSVFNAQCHCLYDSFHISLIWIHSSQSHPVELPFWSVLGLNPRPKFIAHIACRPPQVPINDALLDSDSPDQYS